jgi:hypothetical protein
MKRPKRRCISCDAPLLRGSPANTRFCSTSRRVKDWDRRNRPLPPDPRLERLFSSANPKHYHQGPRGQLLVGHRGNTPWFGAVCPPQCPGLGDGEAFEPMDEFWRQIGASG